MVGRALCRELEARGTAYITKTRAELDLTDQCAVKEFFRRENPRQVILAAAKVGGIHANNTLPAQFIYENLMIEANIIDAAYRNGVERLLFLGSSCIYPKEVPQPMNEDALLTGALEPTNEPYAIAKIAGIKLCESYNRQYGTDFRSVMPTNLYGPHDNFHPENSHVLPAMLRRFHEAKLSGADEVVVWGTGKPRRELLHVDDFALACLHIFDLAKAEYEAHTQPMLSHINVGTGVDISIGELANLVARTVGFEGNIVFDIDKPDGTMRKLLEITKIKALGWKPQISLEVGLAETYKWFKESSEGFE